MQTPDANFDQTGGDLGIAAMNVPRISARGFVARRFIACRGHCRRYSANKDSHRNESTNSANHVFIQKQKKARLT
jgi:hypothetical protein